MNICLVNNLYPPINTGSSFYIRDLAGNLVTKGHKVIVITNLIEGTKYYDKQKGIIIYRLPVIKLPRLKMWMGFPYFNFTLTPSNLKRFKKILINEKVDVIHQCNTIFDLVFASSFWANKLNIPLICSVTTQIQHINLFYNKILDIFDRIIIKMFFSKNVLKYIALDKETERYINVRQKLFNNIVIIPYSIPPENDFQSLITITRDYKKNSYKMISLGHISELKNREEFIKAWAYVVKIIPDAELVIVGGIFSSKIESLIKKLHLEKNIVLTGFVPHSDIQKYIIDADFGGLLATDRLPFNKGFGTANLELMASGLPVIVDADDDFFGNNFPIKANKHFIKAESRDPNWLASKFIELFENSGMREYVGKSAQKFVKEIVSWDRIISEIEKVYKDAILQKIKST